MCYPIPNCMQKNDKLIRQGVCVSVNFEEKQTSKQTKGILSIFSVYLFINYKLSFETNV